MSLIEAASDGKLYVSTGDLGLPKNSQSLKNPSGKILRINADGSIPTDNPCLRKTKWINRAIWAYGLRNPFTFAVQPGTGKILVNDVGFATYEEVNLGKPGANYGWPISEGPLRVKGFARPLYDYKFDDGLNQGCAITGGTFSGSTPFVYQRQRNGVDVPGATGPEWDPGTSLGDDGTKVRVVVANSFGVVTSNEAVLHVTSALPPSAAIITPSEGEKFRVGRVVTLTGVGIDPRDGDLPAPHSPGRSTWTTQVTSTRSSCRPRGPRRASSSSRHPRTSPAAWSIGSRSRCVIRRAWRA